MMQTIRRRPRVVGRGLAIVVCTLALPVLACAAWAQGVSKMVPFKSFQRSTAAARFEDFAKKAGVKVASADEFQKMKAHVASMYEGVKVRNSFVLGERDIVDCVNAKTQPALRQNGKFMPLAKPPKPKIAKENKGDEERQAKRVAPMLSAKKKDALGNVQYCRPGTIPMHRITLDELTRYETLGDFFNKYGKAGEKGDPGSR
jgi:hypothetical protein